MLIESQASVNELILDSLKSKKEKTVYIRNMITFRMQVSRARKLFKNGILSYSFIKDGIETINDISYIKGNIIFHLTNTVAKKKNHWDSFKEEASKLDIAAQTSSESEAIISNLFQGN